MSASNTAVKKGWLEMTFERALSNCEEVAFSPDWAHGDYYNGACKVKLEIGEVVWATAAAPNNRRMILVGTQAGTVVVFERYSPNNNQPFVLVSNAPVALRWLLPSGQLDEATFALVVNASTPVDNIGARLAETSKVASFNGHVS